MRPPWNDLYELFQCIRQWPHMYFPDKSLQKMQELCGGYEMALRAHEIDEFGTGFSSNFADYLYDRFGWDICRYSPAQLIRAHSANDEAAFERFFELLDDYKRHRDLLKAQS